MNEWILLIVAGALLIGMALGAMIFAQTVVAKSGGICILFYGNVPNGAFKRVRLPLIGRWRVLCLPNGVAMEGGGWQFLSMETVMIYVQDGRKGPEVIEALLEILRKRRQKQSLDKIETDLLNTWFTPRILPRGAD